MNAIQNILVPTDFTYLSNAALDEAMLLADLTGARLHLMHVVSGTPMPMGPAIPAASGEMSMIVARNETAARERLGELLTDEQRKRFGAQLVTSAGSPSKSIVRYAKDDGIDLIVMGTHSRGFWSRMIRASVSEQVVKSAPCPVVLCPPQIQHAPTAEAGEPASAMSSLGRAEAYATGA